MQGFPGDLLPVVSDPVVLLTEELQYPTVEFYDYDDQTTSIPQPSGRPLDARDERLRQVSYADGLLWTSGSPKTFVYWPPGTRHWTLAYALSQQVQCCTEVGHEA